MPISCHILVNMPQGVEPTLASWFDIWAAGVAVNTMCIKHGFTGTALWLGRSVCSTPSAASRSSSDHPWISGLILAISGDDEQITITLDAVGTGVAHNVSDVVESSRRA